MRTLIEADRHYVLAIAHALETHKTISGEDIIAIIEGTRGPTVDGAEYDDPVMRAELETYHAAVVRAMLEAGRVLHPLPQLSPVTLLDSPPVPPSVPPAPNGAAEGPTNGSGNGAGNGAGHGYPAAPPVLPEPGVSFPPPRVPPTPPPAAPKATPDEGPADPPR